MRENEKTWASVFNAHITSKQYLIDLLERYTNISIYGLLAMLISIPTCLHMHVTIINFQAV